MPAKPIVAPALQNSPRVCTDVECENCRKKGFIVIAYGKRTCAFCGKAQVDDRDIAINEHECYAYNTLLGHGYHLKETHDEEVTVFNQKVRQRRTEWEIQGARAATVQTFRLADRNGLARFIRDINWDCSQTYTPDLNVPTQMFSLIQNMAHRYRIAEMCINRGFPGPYVVRFERRSLGNTFGFPPNLLATDVIRVQITWPNNF